MATMNISLPDPMCDWIAAQIENGQYASNSDYVRDLIRRDQQDRAARQDAGGKTKTTTKTKGRR